MTTIAAPESILSLLEQDQHARKEALDVGRSFLVQAPAGSGKTQLLTQRLLALLSVVDKPEEVLAITFTRAATAEMRSRVMDELQKARTLLDDGVTEGEDFEKHRLAVAALERSRQLGWSLIEQPQRLNIQTIDSLCLQIAHDFPLLSRLGGQLQPTEDVVPLYSLAARRTIERLGGRDPELSGALEQLLRLRDVNLANCEALIAERLGDRDQWLEEFSLASSLTEEEWAKLRRRREEPLRREHDRIIEPVRRLLHRSPHHVAEMLQLISETCSGSPWPEKIAHLAGLTTLDDLAHGKHLACVSALLLNDDGEWRQRPTINIGFRPLKHGGSREQVNRFNSIISELSKIDGLREALCDLASMPNPEFSEEEWRTIRSIFTVLLRASAELRVVFAERSVIDFVELGMTAELALREPEVRRRWSTRLKHLLVDEFQDTSRRQYTLLKQIVSGWDDPSEKRTCFLVGDPMQSIYLFRNAELALFDEVQQHGFGSEIPLHFTLLTLSRNFRSTAGIVEPINAMFDDLRQRGVEGATRFTPALADVTTSSTNALHLHAHFVTDEAEKASAAQAEADAAVNIIRSHLPALEQARTDGETFRIGVLVKVKQHVVRIAEALREAGIPYRAIEIETLNQRQEIRDLLSLMRALIHPMDRIAWLSVLRAPWCGLSLADLHILSGSDDQKLQKRPIREMLDQRIALLSEDGQRRARRVQHTIEIALARRFSGSFSASPHGYSAWIERTWIALGGPHCIDANAYENVQTFFRLLAKLKPDGSEASGPAFDQRLEKLFAQPDPRAPESCSVQLMTIHKAKGLGFDVVLVPGLDRRKTREESPLLRWVVRTNVDSGDRELLIAPIGAKGADTSATYTWLGRLQKSEERAEYYRLLYVACTRARTALHLFAALKINTTHAGREIAAPSSGSLLWCGWRYLQTDAQQQLQKYLAALTSSPANGMKLMPSPPPDHAGLDIAAATETYQQAMKRLPASWIWDSGSQMTTPKILPATNEEQPRERRGGLASRARGIILHAVFESLAALPESDPRRSVAQSLSHWTTVATAMLQHAGLSRRELSDELKAILSMLQAASVDPDAQWILGRRPHASSEVAWTVVDEDGTHIVRCDRAFLAGADPRSEGEDHLWIVDYKTADGDDSFLLDEQKRYEPQLRRYADALREATQTNLPVRLALYYPALPRLLWWPA